MDGTQFDAVVAMRFGWSFTGVSRSAHCRNVVTPLRCKAPGWTKKKIWSFHTLADSDSTKMQVKAEHFAASSSSEPSQKKSGAQNLCPCIFHHKMRTQKIEKMALSSGRIQGGVSFVLQNDCTVASCGANFAAEPHEFFAHPSTHFPSIKWIFTNRKMK